MLDILLDALFDTLKLLPYLLVTFLVLEYLEHKLSKKNEKVLANNKKYGPIFGGLIGGIPQCGFSAMASNLFSSRVITIGTLIAVFLSTSDEMLPIMIGEKMEILSILSIIGFKVLVGIIIGLFVDIVFNKYNKNHHEIHHMCEEEHCECENDGILLSSIKHTIKIGLFILIANIIIGLLLNYIGEDKLSQVLLHKNILKYFAASLIGLIPNCASSVIITELYVSKLITIGTLLSGLLTGSGLGILLLFRTNKNMKENMTILSIIYIAGVVIGLIVDLVC
jgi:hypothetical protein